MNSPDAGQVEELLARYNVLIPQPGEYRACLFLDSLDPRATENYAVHLALSYKKIPKLSKIYRKTTFFSVEKKRKTEDIFVEFVPYNTVLYGAYLLMICVFYSTAPVRITFCI